MQNESPVSVLVIGVGNAARGDDAAGPLAASRLAEASQPGVNVRALGGEAGELIEAWRGREAVILIDAVVTGQAPAGTIHRWDASDRMPAVEFRQTSSHAFGLGQAIELARALGRLPRRVIVYGVEGTRFGLGDPPTPAVTTAVQEVVQAVRREAERLLKETGDP
jgi:hydrogenase maturation protease